MIAMTTETSRELNLGLSAQEIGVGSWYQIHDYNVKLDHPLQATSWASDI